MIGDKRGPRDRVRAMHGQGGRVSEGQRRPFCLLHLHRTKLLHRHAKRNMGRGEAGERRAGTSAGHGGRRCTGAREGGSAAPSVCCAADHTESRLHAGRTEVQWGSVSLLSALWRLSASEANDADPKLRIYAKRAFQQCAIVIGFSQPLAVCHFPHGTKGALTMHLAGGIGNGLIKPAHAAVVRAPGSGAGGVVGAAEVLPCVPCAGSGVCAGMFSDGVVESGSIVFVSSRNLVRVRNRLVLVCVSRGNSRCA